VRREVVAGVGGGRRGVEEVVRDYGRGKERARVSVEGEMILLLDSVALGDGLILSPS
jgi:hypothetical protein